MRVILPRYRRATTELSAKEREALQKAADGMTIVDIYRTWGHPDVTSSAQAAYARNVLKNVRDKLGADTTAQAVAMGLRRGIIQ